MSGGITAAFLQDLAQEVGVAPVFLEKDWVLTEIIHACATGPYRDELVLKGGQALRHIYGSERLSVDVDYVARQRRIEVADLIATLAIRQPRLDLPPAPAGPTRYGLSIRPIRYRSPLGIRDSRVELEVSFAGTSCWIRTALAIKARIAIPLWRWSWT